MHGIPGETQAAPGIQRGPSVVGADATRSEVTSKPISDLGIDEVWRVQLLTRQ